MTAFDWDEGNIKHIARHSVLPHEVEQAVLDPHAILLEIQMIAAEERTRVLGMTTKGRILISVFTVRDETIRPITSRDAKPDLQEAYLARRAT
jgi:uncharacterized DUF497 family protein